MTDANKLRMRDRLAFWLAFRSLKLCGRGAFVSVEVRRGLSSLSYDSIDAAQIDLSRAKGWGADV